jgi:hypothetical protein
MEYIQTELDLCDNIISGKPRTLINGKKALSYLKPIDLIIHTKCPEKWKIVDMETGEEYNGLAEPNEYGFWYRTKNKNGELSVFGN